MIKIIVIDTNTFISAHLLPQSITRRAFNRAQEIGLLVYSRETLSELVETFGRSKFDKYVTKDERNEVITNFELFGQLVEITSRVIVCRDPKDDKFLALAKDSRAEIIITGDKDLLALNPFDGVKIISATEFLQETF